MGKIALCLYGQPRFLNNSGAINSYKTHLLDWYDTDVYAHYWFNSTQSMYECSDFSLSPTGCSADYIVSASVLPNTEQIINELYQPKAYIFESPRNFSVPEEYRMPLGVREYPSYRDKNLSNLKSQLYSWQKVLELFQDNKKDTVYDWVIISRYDNYILNFPNLNALKKHAVHAHVTIDIAAIDPVFINGIKPYDEFDSILSEVSCFDCAQWKQKAMQRAGAIVYLSGAEVFDFRLIRTAEHAFNF